MCGGSGPSFSCGCTRTSLILHKRFRISNRIAFSSRAPSQQRVRPHAVPLGSRTSRLEQFFALEEALEVKVLERRGGNADDDREHGEEGDAALCGNAADLELVLLVPDVTHLLVDVLNDLLVFAQFNLKVIEVLVDRDGKCKT